MVRFTEKLSEDANIGNHLWGIEWSRGRWRYLENSCSCYL